tara:strand:- start:17 stop:367 length:351 start_codon:yes stop_codon:yes gene_type:complete
MTALPLQTQLSINTNYQATPRHRLVEFGDGYIQRTPLGINYQRRSISVRHDNLSATDAASLILFYEQRLLDAGVIDISANELLRTSGQFYLESFDVQMTDNERRTITASMIEVFDL